MPVFNGERFLGEAIASIQAQGHEQLEIIVVDDGSTDATPELLESLRGQVVALRQENCGPAAARNRGLSHARGATIGFLDADDVWMPGRLRAMLAVLEAEPEVGVVLGTLHWTRAGLGETGPVSPSAQALSLGSALIRRSVFQTVGIFDPSLRYSEDMDWFLRAGEQQIPMRLLNRPVQRVRLHSGNMTRGLSPRDLNVVRVLKRSLERRRQSGGIARPLSLPTSVSARELMTAVSLSAPAT